MKAQNEENKKKENNISSIIGQNIKREMQKIVNDLFEEAKKVCSNDISNNILYVKRFISENDQQSSFSEIKEKRYNDFLKKDFLNIGEIAKEIDIPQSKITWVDFILYFSSNTETIILTECILGKNNSELSFHASIIIPPENIQNNSKFDLNWYYTSIIS